MSPQSIEIIAKPLMCLVWEHRHLACENSMDIGLRRMDTGWKPVLPVFAIISIFRAVDDLLLFLWRQ